MIVEFQIDFFIIGNYLLYHILVRYNVLTNALIDPFNVSSNE